MSFNIYYYLFIAIGIFTIWGAVAKPNFYWNSRKSLRMRKFIGEGGTMILNVLIGIAFIIFGILGLAGLISLFS